MKTLLAELKPRLCEIFDHLHQHPEVSWQETETTAYLSKLLEAEGFQVRTFCDCTGLVVEYGDGPYTVGLRSDIDSLWQEVGGTFQANHSCGHDAHMTMTLGVLLLLKKLNYQPSGKLKFIFQPAEEKGTGALKMVEKGVIDDLDFLYGVHLRPIQELQAGEAAPAILHGAAKFIAGEIIGEDAHGARPHLGKNAIEIGASLVQELSKIHLDPMIPYSVKMTKFHAGGESSNLIPGHASFHLDLRAQTNDAMEFITKKVITITKALAEMYEVEIPLETKAEVVGATVHPKARELMAKAITDTLGAEHLVEPAPTSGGEDFHFYTLKRPQLKATMLGLGCDLKPGLHHPDMTFNRDAIFDGIEILTKTILNTFEFLEGGTQHDGSNRKANPS
ncbi:M20 peptidase aminoacylase family protein [Neobacillus sp. OS1-32]|jgi:amidohydrolase|uniref:M20 peptidase aminoacylase family protein n=1 Tax=Neobacillus paridis TaxID=2803862 RepID=A0ABS1TXU1_9BACI|nr:MULTISPECIES: M20 peptidase aminoacylase family protein [Neobacillus]MBL4954720.1 M20 peptidase aminoacylase family protein [Neobacillus paridis]WML29862.1 M20 peptidase aminoacylase family protein [Neobacillus sp. OS1-32]